MDIEAERIPGTEEFMVKTITKGDKPTTMTEKMITYDLKHKLDHIYKGLANVVAHDMKMLGLPVPKHSKNLLRYHDLPSVHYLTKENT